MSKKKHAFEVNKSLDGFPKTIAILPPSGNNHIFFDSDEEQEDIASVWATDDQELPDCPGMVLRLLVS
jgi:hypothetical protein